MSTDAINCYQNLSGENRVLLHSGRVDYGQHSSSFVAENPSSIFSASYPEVQIDGVPQQGELFELLDNWLADFSAKSVAIGFIGYEAGQFVEQLPRRKADTPDVWFGRYDKHFSFSHKDNGEPKSLPTNGTWKLAALLDQSPRRDYGDAIAKIKEYIASGDIYQANFARLLTAQIEQRGEAIDLYRCANAISPATFGAVIDAGTCEIISLSPELFLRRTAQGVLTTAPIKGTRKRAGSTEDDIQRAIALRRTPKELAEHLMIVDLERNDLGRVAQTGTVHVDPFANIKMFPKVIHLVSEVSCLPEACSSIGDILRATFPGGSITGAPKIRAQQVIHETEKHPRGPYTGAIGMLKPDGSINLSIAIRTATIVGSQLRLHFGGGIVADSTAAREFEETEEKAAAWRAILDSFQN